MINSKEPQGEQCWGCWTMIVLFVGGLIVYRSETLQHVLTAFIAVAFIAVVVYAVGSGIIESFRKDK